MQKHVSFASDIRPLEPKSFFLNQPLSLQQTTILYVVTNLELFPPDVLALLPLKFRRELLLLLPPADIFQLEQTSIVGGIDIENEVWKVVCERYDYKIVSDRGDPILPKGMQWRKDSAISGSWKSTFLCCLFTLLVHMEPFNASSKYISWQSIVSSKPQRSYLVFLQLLFATEFIGLEELMQSSIFIVEAFGMAMHLSRYSQFLSGGKVLKVPDWIIYLLDDCHQSPPSIIAIEEQHFLSNVLIPNVDEDCTVKQFERLFKNADDVMVTVHFPYLFYKDSEHKVEVEKKINKLLWFFTSCHNHLKELELSECVALVHAVDSHLFDSVLKKLFGHYLTSSTSITGNPNLTFPNLCHLHVSGWFRNTKVTMSALLSLLAVCLQHKRLESLLVSEITIIESGMEHLNVLSKLKRTSTLPVLCSSITLAGISKLPFSLFHWLLWKHIFSSSDNSLYRTLIMRGCSMDYRYLISENGVLHSLPPESVDTKPLHKSLHLINISFDHTLLVIIASLHRLVLEDLQVEHIAARFNNNSGEKELSDFVNRLTLIPVCKIKRFTIRYVMSHGYRLLDSSLRPNDVKSIESIYSFMRHFPATAVTLQCVVTTNAQYLGSLFKTLHTEWEKTTPTSEDVVLEKLIIHLDRYAKPSFQPQVIAWIETAISLYSIKETTKAIEVLDRHKKTMLLLQELD